MEADKNDIMTEKKNKFEKCDYCQSEFRKYGLKPHLQRCKAKIEYDKNNIIKKICKKKFEIDYGQHIQSDSWLDKLPKELLKIIISYLEGTSDKYYSYRRFFRDYLGYCTISKRLYNIFYPSFELILVFKENLKNERDKRICKSTAKAEYKLSDDELENKIIYVMFKNPHFSSSPAMKLYQLADVLDYLYDKYGSYKEHKKLLDLEEAKKEQAREKRENDRINRVESFNALMNKYALNDGQELYNVFYNNYVNKSKLGIRKMETMIQMYLQNGLQNSAEEYLET